MFSILYPLIWCRKKVSQVPKKYRGVRGRVMLICWVIFIKIRRSLQRKTMSWELFRQAHRSDYFTSMVPNLGGGAQTKSERLWGDQEDRTWKKQTNRFSYSLFHLSRKLPVLSPQTPSGWTGCIHEGLQADLLHSKRSQALTTALLFFFSFFPFFVELTEKNKYGVSDPSLHQVTGPTSILKGSERSHSSIFYTSSS